MGKSGCMAVFYIFLSLFWAVLGLRCCAGFSTAMVSGGYSLVASHALLTAVVSVVASRL